MTGTPYRLHYASDRVTGRAVGRQITIYFGSTAPGQIPEFRGVELEVSVAGKVYQDHLATIPTSPYEFTAWDGRDAFGREVNGTAPTTVRIGHTYQGVYRRMADFGHHGNGTLITGSATRQTLTIWQTFELQLESWDARGAGLGGWTLNVNHSYDPVGHLLRAGDGSRRAFAAQSSTVRTIPGVGFPYDVAVAPTGSTYVGGGSQVARIDPDGSVHVVAGTTSPGFNGEDGLATAIQLNNARSLDVGPDGDLYILDAGNHKVRRLFLTGPQAGQITTVVARGNCTPSCTFGPAVDGVTAADARLSSPLGLAVGPDGSIYIADQGNHRVRQPKCTWVGFASEVSMERSTSRALASGMREQLGLATMSRNSTWDCYCYVWGKTRKESNG